MFGDKMFYKIKNGSIEINGNLILENINFSIREKEKIGLIIIMRDLVLFLKYL